MNKSVLIFAGILSLSCCLISCEKSGSTTVRSNSANIVVSQNGSEKVTVQQTGNSSNVVINKDGEKSLTVTTGNSTVEIGKSGINVKNAGVAEDSEQNRSISAGGKTITIETNRETQTVNCDGGEVTVNGNRNNLTVRGVCAISVNGNDNVLSAEVASSISTSGNNNKVSWAKGVDGKKPEISNSGSGNTVSQNN